MLCVILGFQSVGAQSIEVHGRIESEADVENIHVINKTSQKFTISDTKGIFKITAKLNDTITFSSIQHQLKIVVVDKQIIAFKTILVQLVEQINVLDEVVVGKVLTGNLFSDINNMDGKAPINFYDVGIPGYKGKVATQSERRLSQAGEFKPIMLVGLLLGGGSLDPILNGISGRTKMLKERVKHESNNDLLRQVKSRVAKDFLISNPLEVHLVEDFFYFCEADEYFNQRCTGKNDFEILIFLRLKYRQYMENKEIIRE